LRRDAWENNNLRRDDDNAKIAAFDDAAAVMRFLLDEKSAPATETASLLKTLYLGEKATSDTTSEDSNAMRRHLLEELRQSRAENVEEILTMFFASLGSGGPGTSGFAAALSLIEASHLSTVVDPTPLITAYCEALARDDYSLSAHQISIPQAVALLDLAMRTESDLQKRFFDPLEVSKRLDARFAPDANTVMIAQAVARSVRVHVRVLCRAVAGQHRQPPDSLIDALVSSIRIGSLARLEKGQVDAFSAQYEIAFMQNQFDRAISADLGDAVNSLLGEQRTELLEAILQIEEPLVLARLLTSVPSDSRGKIESRLLELTVIDLGKTKQLWLRIVADTRAVALVVEMRSTKQRAVWKKYLQPSAWEQHIQKYALALATILLISTVTMTIAYRNETVRQHARIESVEKELAQEKVLRAAIQPQLANTASQLTASFRLPPDDVKIRGSQEQNLSRIAIPSNAVLVRLELPINNSDQGRYRATLKSLSEATAILREDNLTPAAGPAGSEVIFSVPASVFQTDHYYVVALDILGKDGRQKDTRTFTFYLVNR
jgi:hypothetical protein